MDLDEIDNIKTPDIDDILFEEDEFSYFNAILNFIFDDWHLYAQGYKLAGEILYKYIEGNKVDQDFLVYPFIFLYRHFIELTLKDIIKTGNKYLKDREEFSTIHEIDKLWAEVKKIIIEIKLEVAQDILRGVDSYMSQLSRIDPSSFSFRYPKDKSGRKYLPGYRRIGLKNFYEKMKILSSFLEGVNQNIAVIEENKTNT